MFIDPSNRPLIRPHDSAKAHPVIAALARAGRPLSNSELARAIGCSHGHASRLRKQVADEIYTYRRGRSVYTAHISWRPALRWFPYREEVGGMRIEST